MSRPVDQAMGEDRPDKQTMRRLWAQAVSEADGEPNGPPLYLTLPGAHGRDVQCLIDAGLVSLAENGVAIASEDLWKIVAVERSNQASLALRRRWKGLRVLNQDIGAVLASTGPLTWPRGDHERWCRAHVVNFDLNSALGCERDETGQLVFPTIQLIWKLAQLHLKRPALDWALCLTVAAEIIWGPDDCKVVQSFLRENFAREQAFAHESRALLGSRLFDDLMGDEPLDMRTLTGPQKQAVLMVFVPKKIVTETHGLGWRMTTTHNLRYGGDGRSQRMVSWVMRFIRDPRVSAEPHAVYRESLEAALARTGVIASDGALRSS